MNRAHSAFRVAHDRAGMTGKSSPGHSNYGLQVITVIPLLPAVVMALSPAR